MPPKKRTKGHAGRDKVKEEPAPEGSVVVKQEPADTESSASSRGRLGSDPSDDGAIGIFRQGISHQPSRAELLQGVIGAEAVKPRPRVSDEEPPVQTNGKRAASTTKAKPPLRGKKPAPKKARPNTPSPPAPRPSQRPRRAAAQKAKDTLGNGGDSGEGSSGDDESVSDEDDEYKERPGSGASESDGDDSDLVAEGSGCDDEAPPRKRGRRAAGTRGGKASAGKGTEGGGAGARGEKEKRARATAKKKPATRDAAKEHTRNKMFAAMDRGGKGYVTEQDLVAVLVDVGLTNEFTAEEIREMFAEVDKDKNGAIDPEEFNAICDRARV